MVGLRENNEVAGRYEEGATNSSGDDLIDFCKQYNLRILISQFPHKRISRSPGEKYVILNFEPQIIKYVFIPDTIYCPVSWIVYLGNKIHKFKVYKQVYSNKLLQFVRHYLHGIRRRYYRYRLHSEIHLINS